LADELERLDEVLVARLELLLSLAASVSSVEWFAFKLVDLEDDLLASSDAFCELEVSSEADLFDDLLAAASSEFDFDEDLLPEALSESALFAD
jgi:hypothetical protein